jgi:hypothetical protein
MFPVYNNVPLFAITTIAALESGMEVSVLGSREVGYIIDELKNYYKKDDRKDVADRLKWVPELDGLENYALNDRAIIAKNRRKLTQNKSMKRLAASLDLDEDDAFIWAAGDIIFYDYLSVANDYDIYANSLIADLNSKEMIDPPCDRNWYHLFIPGHGGRVHIKEPNVWVFGEEFNLGLSDKGYSHAQKGGFGIWAFLKMAGINMMKNPHKVTIRDLCVIGECLAQESLWWLTDKTRIPTFTPRYYQEDIESLGKFLNMSPIRVKAEHDDYLRLKDVDAMHDLGFIIKLLQGGLENIFPENMCNSIKGFDNHLGNSDIIEKIVSISDIHKMLNFKTERIQYILDKKGFEYEVERLYDDDGNFIGNLRPEDDLEKAIEKSQKYLKVYNERLNGPR